MKRMLIAGAIALAAGGQALAADLPMPAPPPRAPAAYVPIIPPFTWSGIYIGANGGYSWGKITPTAPAGLTSFNANGIVAGGTIGGNIQAGAFVFGAEGDFDWDNIKGTPALCVGCQASSTWLATARGRVGVALDRVLISGTGGAAFQQVKFTPPAPFASATSNPFGWTAGGGVEYGLFAELVGQGRIPLHQLQQQDDRRRDVQPDRKRGARRHQLSVLMTGGLGRREGRRAEPLSEG
jgi:outer membrane immunogenic protein